MDSANILDKILENKQEQDLFQFSPQAVLINLFSVLNEREQEVLTRRFGLHGRDPQTLEVIGKEFGVTRERVRQIETGSIKKLLKLKTLEDELKQVQTVIHQLIQDHGGVMQEDHLMETILEHAEDSKINRAILIFVVEKLLQDKFDHLYHADHYHRSWKLITHPTDKIENLVNHLINLIDDHGDPLEEEDVISKISDLVEDELEHQVVRGHLRVSKKLKQNIFGKWGRAHWSSITPKRINDKIYLVLQFVKKPLHFTEIAEKINELNFDHKVAYPATVHNELILDKKYVLVGRGIYALQEWGYKPGVVAEVIERILSDEEKPLTREEIVARVLEERIVGKSTIHLSLMNKEKFDRLEDGRYQIKLS